jgi:hypothetical protein
MWTYQLRPKTAGVNICFENGQVAFSRPDLRPETILGQAEMSIPVPYSYFTMWAIEDLPGMNRTSYFEIHISNLPVAVVDQTWADNIVVWDWGCRIRFFLSQTWLTLTKCIEKYSNNCRYFTSCPPRGIPKVVSLGEETPRSGTRRCKEHKT